jgi:hypothetical protein
MSLKSATVVVTSVTAAIALGFAPTAALATDVVHVKAVTPQLAAASASARPAPEPDRQSAPTPTCPTRPDIARQMRGYGMSAQGAKNIAEFAYRDCIHGTSST